MAVDGSDGWFGFENAQAILKTKEVATKFDYLAELCCKQKIRATRGRPGGEPEIEIAGSGFKNK